MKRKYISCIIFLYLFCSALFSCSSNYDAAYVPPKDYRLWKKPVREILDYPVPGHGASFRVIYANDTAFGAAAGKNESGRMNLSYPDGSVIIKEVYKNKADVNWASPELTIMVKDSVNKYSRGGWLYFVKRPDANSAMPVRGRMCIGCHEAANDRHPYFDKNPEGESRDFVFVNIGK